jgi:superfamily II DNA helicase RecQ
VNRFQAVQAAINAFPQADLTASLGEFRVVDAIAELGSRSTATDLTGLIRHELRRVAEITSVGHLLTVPCERPWPTEEEWAQAAVRATRSGDRYVLRGDPWTPSWLPGSEDIAPDAAAAAGRRRRRDERVVGDPFLLRLDPNISSYLTAGQRQAVRTVLSSPPDRTIVVNLPTGSGKTLAAIAPGLLNRQHGRTVVVVPTTTLALDHERRLAEQLREDPSRATSAYHGGLSTEDKERLRSEFRSGDTPVLFTSPESLVGGLSWVLDDVAAKGELAYFVVDEAHIISEWGDEFRPEFQAMAGIRRHLRRRMLESGRAPFRTVLMTGTLTEPTLETILGIFGDDNTDPEVVSSVLVRPEPEYWIASTADSADERDQRLLEAVASLPRPVLVYTTLVRDRQYRGGSLSTQRAEALLKQAGYRRIARVDGDTSPARRRAVIAALRGDPATRTATECDIVVASSAFGLGVDISDVRSVIHACVPETIDRYYQDVGRAGRDGRASVSVMSPGPDDRDTARALNHR